MKKALSLVMACSSILASCNAMIKKELNLNDYIIEHKWIAPDNNHLQHPLIHDSQEDNDSSNCDDSSTSDSSDSEDDYLELTVKTKTNEPICTIKTSFDYDAEYIKELLTVFIDIKNNNTFDVREIEKILTYEDESEDECQDFKTEIARLQELIAMYRLINATNEPTKSSPKINPITTKPDTIKADKAPQKREALMYLAGSFAAGSCLTAGVAYYIWCTKK